MRRAAISLLALLLVSAISLQLSLAQEGSSMIHRLNVYLDALWLPAESTGDDIWLVAWSHDRGFVTWAALGPGIVDERCCDINGDGKYDEGESLIDALELFTIDGVERRDLIYSADFCGPVSSPDVSFLLVEYRGNLVEILKGLNTSTPTSYLLSGFLERSGAKIIGSGSIKPHPREACDISVSEPPLDSYWRIGSCSEWTGSIPEGDAAVSELIGVELKEGDEISAVLFLRLELINTGIPCNPVESSVARAWVTTDLSKLMLEVGRVEGSTPPELSVVVSSEEGRQEGSIKVTRTSTKWGRPILSGSVRDDGGIDLLLDVSKHFGQRTKIEVRSGDKVISELSIEIPRPEIWVVANNVDYALATPYLGRLALLGLSHATAEPDEISNLSGAVVILGGFEAYSGVGKLVEELFRAKGGEKEVEMISNILERTKTMLVAMPDPREPKERAVVLYMGVDRFRTRAVLAQQWRYVLNLVRG